MAHRQKAQVMGAVPIVLSGNMFSTIVSILQIVRYAELFDGIRIRIQDQSVVQQIRVQTAIQQVRDGIGARSGSW